MDEYRDCMGPNFRLEESLQVANEALRAFQYAVDSWDAGDDEDVEGAVGCAIAALTSLAEAIIGAGLDVPDDLSHAIGVLGSFRSRACPTN